MNYFELFGLKESPRVDDTVLNRKYVDLQRKCHPDFYTGSEASEMEEMMELSSAVNKAYSIFKNPMSTIAYYLQMRGVMTEEEKYSLPADFLMDMMEVNEKIDEGEKDQAREDIARMELQMDAEMVPVFAECENGGGGAPLLRLKDYYYRKKYLQRILDRFND